MNHAIFFAIRWLALFFIIFFFSCSLSISSKQDVSTVYSSMPDTLLARNYLKQTQALKDSAKYTQALEYTKKAIAIYIATVGDSDTLTALGYIIESDIFLETFDFQKALEKAQRVKEISLKKVDESHYLVAIANFNIGFSIERLNNKGEEALSYYEKALRIKGVHKQVWILKGKAYRRMGIVYRNSNKLDLALKCFNRAISLYNNNDKNNPELANIYISKGLTFEKKNKFDQAISQYHKAKAIFNYTSGENHPNMAKVHRTLGTAMAKQGRFVKARENYEKALKIFINTFGENHRLVGGIYHNLGVVSSKMGDYERALYFLQRSLNIKSKSNDRNIYTTYNSIGNVMQLAGRYDEALLFFLKSLDDYKHNGNAKDDSRLGSIYDNIGIVYELKNDYSHANKYYQKALTTKKQILEEDDPILAETYFSLGSLARKQGNWKEALVYYHKSLEINISTLGEGHLTVANIYNDLGIIHRVKGDYPKAILMFQKAQHIFVNTFGENHPNIASSYQNIGLVYNDLGKDKLAVTNLRKAANILRYNFNFPQIFSNVVNLNGLQSVFNSLAEYYSNKLKNTKQQHYQDSLKTHYQNWLALEEYIQLEHTNSDTRQHYVNTSLSVYEGTLGNLLQFDEPENRYKAWTLSEKTKSRQLTEKIQAESYTANLRLPDSLRQQEYELGVDIAYYEKKKFQEEYEKTVSNDSLIQVYQNQIFDLREKRTELLNKFKKEYPTYYNARYNIDVIGVSQVQQNLSSEQSLIEYFVGDSTIYLFLVQRDNYEVFSIKKDFPLDTLVENLRQGLYGYYSISEDEQTDQLYVSLQKQYPKTARQLYQKLLSPITNKLTNELVIIPDGVLGYIPFETLLTNDVTDEYSYNSYPYLLKKHYVSYAYSATLLHEMQKKQHLHKPTKKILAMAPFSDTGYTQHQNIISKKAVIDTTVRSLEFSLTSKFKRLPNSRQEVEEAFKTWNGDCFLNEKATERLFSRSSGNYRIIHLATHGQADYRYGDYSFLAFSQIADSIENELLYVSDIYGLHLNADLVVLSACNTGVGELKRGEGIISLARAFAYAGAKSMVTSLWKVNDASTKDLMIYFHHNLKTGMAKDRAIQQAKLEYINKQSNAEFSHPYFWGSFIAIGDMSEMTN